MRIARSGPAIICLLFLGKLAAGLNPAPALAGPPLPGETQQFPLPGNKTNLAVHLPGFQMGEKVGP
jgi:hypothetical protein